MEDFDWVEKVLKKDQEVCTVLAAPFRTAFRWDESAGRTQLKWVWGTKKLGLCGGLGSHFRRVTLRVLNNCLLRNSTGAGATRPYLLCNVRL